MRSGHKEYLLIGAILLGTMLVPVNSTMIAVGLAAISDYFGQSLASIGWVVTIYLIVMAVTQPIAGKLGDIYGNRTVFIWGIGLFFVSSVLCAFSFQLWWLIVFRSLQALGGALLTPNASAILRRTVSAERLGRVFGLFGMGMGLGAAIGPLVGSLLIGAWGWQSIFWVNVPFLLFALLATSFVPATRTGRKASLDLLGSVYLAAGFTLLILLTNVRSAWVFAAMAAALIVFAVLFVRRENRVSEPLIDFKLFAHRPFASANVSILLSNFIMYATILTMPLVLQNTFRYSTETAGAMLFCFSMTMTVCGWVGGYLSDRMSKAKLIAWSFLLSLAAGALYFGLEPVHALPFALPYIVGSLIVGGMGGGLGMTAMQTASLESVSKEMSGIASGIYSTFRYFGSMIASTLVSLSLGSSRMYWTLLVFAAAGLVVSRGLRRTGVHAPEGAHGKAG